MVFDWLVGRNKAAPSAPEPRRHPPGPLGLRVDRSVDIDLIEQAMVSDRLSMPVGAEITLVITGHGIVELEPGVFLHRFYDNEHRFLQIMAQGRGEEATPSDATFFRHWDSVVPAPAQWPAWIEPGGRIGAKRYDADGTVFDRFWQADAEGWVPPVEFTETVIDDEGARRRIRQRLMLYDRMVSEEAGEVLLVSMEQAENAPRHDASVEFYLGYPVSLAAIRPV